MNPRTGLPWRDDQTIAGQDKAEAREPMGLISVVVRTQNGVATWGVRDDVAEARFHSLGASINGRDVEWMKIVEPMDGDPTADRN